MVDTKLKVSLNPNSFRYFFPWRYIMCVNLCNLFIIRTHNTMHQYKKIEKHLEMSTITETFYIP